MSLRLGAEAQRLSRRVPGTVTLHVALTAIDQYALPELKLHQGLGVQTTNFKAYSVELVPFFKDEWENVPIFQTSDRAAMH